MAADVSHSIDDITGKIRTVSWTMGAIAGILGMIWPPTRKIILYVFRLLKSYVTMPLRLEASEAKGDTRHAENLGRLNALIAEMTINTQLAWAALQNELAFTADPFGNCTRSSDKWCDLVRMSNEESLGMGWLMAIDGPDRERVRLEWKRCVAEKQQYLMTCRYRIGNTGKTILVETFAKPIWCRRGDLTGFIGKMRVLEQA